MNLVDCYERLNYIAIMKKYVLSCYVENSNSI